MYGPKPEVTFESPLILYGDSMGGGSGGNFVMKKSPKFTYNNES
jgi:hypothetical protein